MTTPIVRRLFALCLSASVLTVIAPSTTRAAEGEPRFGLHVTLASKWLDPADTEAFQTPYMVLYAVHDALVKPMLAESTAGAVPGYPYTAPMEDPTLKK